MKAIILSAFFCMLSILVGYYVGINQPKNITLQKSSDSEWEVSPVSMPDTTITDTIFISGDTVYPTAHYLNVKIK